MDWKLELVTLLVADVDRARDYYAEQVGFTLDLDLTTGSGMRVVQLTPPGSGCSISLQPGGGAPARLQLVVSDLDTARAELAERGVPVSPIRHVGPEGWADGRGEPWNNFVFFTDPDGHEWAVQERP